MVGTPTTNRDALRTADPASTSNAQPNTPRALDAARTRTSDREPIADCFGHYHYRNSPMHGKQCRFRSSPDSLAAGHRRWNPTNLDTRVEAATNRWW